MIRPASCVTSARPRFYTCSPICAARWWLTRLLTAGPSKGLRALVRGGGSGVAAVAAPPSQPLGGRTSLRLVFLLILFHGRKRRAHAFPQQLIKLRVELGVPTEETEHRIQIALIVHLHHVN